MFMLYRRVELGRTFVGLLVFSAFKGRRSARKGGGCIHERNADGRTFARIGTVAAASSSSAARSYALLDARLSAGAARLYDRLKQVDVDSTFSYSPVRTVSLTHLLNYAFTLFPAPCRARARRGYAQGYPARRGRDGAQRAGPPRDLGPGRRGRHGRAGAAGRAAGGRVPGARRGPGPAADGGVSRAATSTPRSRRPTRGGGCFGLGRRGRQPGTGAAGRQPGLAGEGRCPFHGQHPAVSGIGFFPIFQAFIFYYG